jgi:hypothetical protein
LALVFIDFVKIKVQDLRSTFSKRFPIDKNSVFSRLTSAQPPRLRRSEMLSEFGSLEYGDFERNSSLWEMVNDTATPPLLFGAVACLPGPWISIHE